MFWALYGHVKDWIKSAILKCIPTHTLKQASDASCEYLGRPQKTWDLH